MSEQVENSQVWTRRANEGGRKHGTVGKRLHQIEPNIPARGLGRTCGFVKVLAQMAENDFGRRKYWVCETRCTANVRQNSTSASTAPACGAP